MTITQLFRGMFHSRPSASHEFRADVLRGLRAPQKYLPPKYFYDDFGSQLFERITELDEYYLTRTELAIMEQYAGEMAELLGPRCLLIEYGSGSSTKTRLLLDRLCDPAGYMPVDIAHEQLQRSACAIAEDYPTLEVMPVCADLTQPFRVPTPRRPPARRAVYFPGSTIGNLTPDEAIALLRRTARLCGRGGALLLGADLRKDPRVIEAAYNDRRGITAAFNRNLLVRINRELGTDFDPEQFAHRAFYNLAEGRVEMHLVSLRDQSVRIDGAEFHFAAGETIHTENSYKYSVSGLQALARAGGFEPQRVWTDDDGLFSVHYLIRKPAGLHV
jgi:dimethylhistidine N-methyltransferase